MKALSRADAIVSWGLQLTVAAILMQTLFFKFTAAPESVYIFRTLGVDPWGRLATGTVELVASLLLLAPGTAPAGALLAFVVMAGAVVTHLTVLGIEVQGDGGLLFGLALLALTASAGVLGLRRGQLVDAGGRLRWLKPERP